MRLLFAGTPEAAVPSLDALLDSDHDVVAVLTRPDARTGRGRTLTPSPVKVRADAAGVPVLVDNPRDPAFVDTLTALDVDAAPVVAYGRILPAAVLAIPTHGWINLHFSVLPAWRGAAPVQRAIIAGDDVTGATTFRIGAGLDDGPVYGHLTETIRPRDTAGDLMTRLARAGAGLLLATLDHIADGTAAPIPQPTTGISHAPKLTRPDTQITWTHPALAIDRLIRGATPNPGAWTTLGATPLGIGPARPRPDITDLPPGRLRATKNEVLVGTATHALQLGDITPPGKKTMPAPDWARGARLTGTETLGDHA